MSDNLRRYCAIQLALKQLSPTEPSGNLARHLNTLAALISGIVGSKRTDLPAIASKVPDGRKRESRCKRFARFLQNKSVTSETFFLPYTRALVASLPPGPLVLVMDGSQIGRGCMALMHGSDAQCPLPAGLCHSRLSDPERLARMLVATCLAYYWMVCLVAEVMRRGWQSVVHRAERYDLSLFQMGLIWLEHCLNEGRPVPVPLQAQACK